MRSEHENVLVWIAIAINLRVNVQLMKIIMGQSVHFLCITYEVNNVPQYKILYRGFLSPY